MTKPMVRIQATPIKIMTKRRVSRTATNLTRLKMPISATKVIAASVPIICGVDQNGLKSAPAAAKPDGLTDQSLIRQMLLP